MTRATPRTPFSSGKPIDSLKPVGPIEPGNSIKPGGPTKLGNPVPTLDPSSSLNQLLQAAKRGQEVPDVAQWDKMARAFEQRLFTGAPDPSPLARSGLGFTTRLTPKAVAKALTLGASVAAVAGLLYSNGFSAAQPLGPSTEVRTIESGTPSQTIMIEQPDDALARAAEVETTPHVKALEQPLDTLPAARPRVSGHPPAQARQAQAPETQAPPAEAPELRAPEAEAPEIRAPELRAPELRAPEPKAADDFSEGLRRLEAAEQMLRQGRNQAAAKLLRAPIHPGLVSRAWVLRAVAACQSGQLERGRRMVAAHEQRHPNSPYTQRLKSACKE